MFSAGFLDSSAFAISFAPLSLGLTDSAASNLVDHFVGISGGYTPFRPASILGRMDCVGVDHSDHCKRRSDMRDEEDPRE